MKFKVLIITMLLIFSFGVNNTMAQEKAPKVFTFVDQKAKYPGGQTAIAQYVQSRLTYPKEALRQGTMGKVYVSFVITPRGKMINVEVMRGIRQTGGDLLNREALNVIKKMAKEITWEPAIYNGKKVYYRSRIPISFQANKRAIKAAKKEYKQQNKR